MSATQSWLLAIAALVLTGASWFFVGRSYEGRPVSLPDAFGVENLQQSLARPGEMERLFSSAAYQELTGEQRRQVGRNKAKAFFESFEDRVDRYFEASDAEREAMLDSHLDELAAEVDAKRKNDDPDAGKAAKPVMSRAQRKAKSESFSPDRMARIMAYKNALHERACARGIKLDGR